MAIPRIRLQSMMFTKGYMIRRHQAMISKRIRSRIVVSKIPFGAFWFFMGKGIKVHYKNKEIAHPPQRMNK